MENYSGDINHSTDPQILQPQPKQPNGMATVSMVIGIVALMGCCVPMLQFVLGMAGVVLAILSKNGRPFTGQAMAGIILSSVSIAISLVVFASVIFTYQMLRDPEVGPMYNQMYQEMLQYWEQMGAPVN